MSTLFNTYLYQPILSVLVWIYHTIAFEDLGFAIILLTVLVRLVLFPVFHKGARDQALMQRLQPKIKKLQEEHKDNKEVQAKALMALYKDHKLNPFSGFLLLLVQLPIFIALFQIFTKELGSALFDSHLLFGLINLETRNIWIAVLAAILQYAQGKLSLKPTVSSGGDAKEAAAVMTGKVMVWIGPLFTLGVLFRLPAALGVYWTMSTLFSVVQQMYINKRLAEEHKKLN